MSKQIVTLFAREEGMDLVRRHCRQINLPVADLQQMLEQIIEKDPLLSRSGLRTAFDEILDGGEAPDEDLSSRD